MRHREGRYVGASKSVMVNLGQQVLEVLSAGFHGGGGGGCPPRF